MDGAAVDLWWPVRVESRHGLTVRERPVSTSVVAARRYRVRRADEEYYWIEANGRVDHGPDGTPLSFPDARERARGRETARRRPSILAVVSGPSSAAHSAAKARLRVASRLLPPSPRPLRYGQRGGPQAMDRAHDDLPPDSHGNSYATEDLMGSAMDQA